MEARRTQSDTEMQQLAGRGLLEPSVDVTFSEETGLKSTPPESPEIAPESSPFADKSSSDSECTELSSDECAMFEIALNEENINPPLPQTLSNPMSLAKSSKSKRQKLQQRHGLDEQEISTFMLIKTQAELWLNDGFETLKKNLFYPHIFLELHWQVTQEVIYKLQRELLKHLFRVSVKKLFDKHSQGFFATPEIYLAEHNKLTMDFKAVEKELTEKDECSLTISSSRRK